MQKQVLRALDIQPLLVAARAEDEKATVLNNRYGDCAESDHRMVPLTSQLLFPFYSLSVSPLLPTTSAAKAFKLLPLKISITPTAASKLLANQFRISTAARESPP